MTIKEIIEILKQIRNQPNRASEEVEAIDKAITYLQRNNTRDQWISASKILADLIHIGIKIFDS